MHFLQCNSIYSVQKQPVGSVHEVLAESLETVFDGANFLVNLFNFLQPLALPMHTFPPSEPFVQAEQLPKPLSSRHFINSLSVYLFLNSEP